MKISQKGLCFKNCIPIFLIKKSFKYEFAQIFDAVFPRNHDLLAAKLGGRHWGQHRDSGLIRSVLKSKMATMADIL